MSNHVIEVKTAQKVTVALHHNRGLKGDTGIGIPTGGTVGQFVRKTIDNLMEWVNCYTKTETDTLLSAKAPLENPALTGTPTINGEAITPYTNRNKIINGNFAVNQRGVSGTVTLAAGAYGHDRWKAGASGCTYTFATVENVTTLTITAGSLLQIIEGVNLFSGTHTLSWAGTAQGKIGAGAYSVSGVTGTATGGTNLNIEFNTGTLAKVQFEQGSVPTPFEARPIGQELLLCQRYYATGNQHLRGYSTNTVYTADTVVFPTTLRTTPTVATSDIEVENVATKTMDASDKYSRCLVIPTATGGFIWTFTWFADAEL